MAAETLLGFHHRYLPGRGGAGPVLLLLHGTGGNEDDLLGLGKMLWPGAALLSPRGKVLEQGMPRFFRRLAEGVFDEADLIARTHELAAFLEAAAAHYRFSAERLVAVGFSNGANIAASLLLLQPKALRAAILLHAMVPLTPAILPNLTGRPVFLTAGRQDAMIPPAQAEALAALLRQAGAEVTLHWTPAGHQLTAPEADAARQWLAAEFPP